MGKHQARRPGGRHRAPDLPKVGGDPVQREMISTTEAARILGTHSRTVIRWVDTHKIRGGRASDPITGEQIARAPRWVDARQAVAYAVGAGREHLIPDRWRYLIEAVRTAGDGSTPAQSNPLTSP